MPMLLASREWAASKRRDPARRAAQPDPRRPLRSARAAADRCCCPPELVFGHPGFLRPCDGIRLPGAQQLFTYAVDIARDADGRLRAGRPHPGAVGRGLCAGEPGRHLAVFPSLYRDSQVHRLAPFFRALRASAAGLSPRPALTIRGSSC